MKVADKRNFLNFALKMSVKIGKPTVNKLIVLNNHNNHNNNDNNNYY